MPRDVIDAPSFLVSLPGSIRPGSFAKYNPNQPRDERGRWTAIHRGIHLVNLPPDASDAEILDRLQRNPGSGDDFEAQRMAVDPESVNRWPLFGQHWTATPSTARTFALHASTNLSVRGPGARSRRPRTGVVLEARVKGDVARSEFHEGYGEQEVIWPGRDAIESIVAHVHHLPANQSVYSADTYVRSFEVPREVWDVSVRKYNPNQPRVPAGNPNGGQWTDGGGSGGFLLDTREGRSRFDNMTLSEQIAWAESEANPYRTGKVIGGDTRSGDYRVEVDPRRRFTEMWQRVYENYWNIRDATINVLDGKDPLHGLNVASDGNPLRDKNYTIADYEQDVSSAARYMADGIRKAKPGETLYRGTSLPSEVLQNWQAGSDLRVTLGPTSTSSDRTVAERYQVRRPPGHVRTLFMFHGSTRRFDLRHSDWHADHPESIVMGEFEVTNVYVNHREAVVSLKPVSQP